MSDPWKWNFVHIRIQLQDCVILRIKISGSHLNEVSEWNEIMWGLIYRYFLSVFKISIDKCLVYVDIALFRATINGSLNNVQGEEQIHRQSSTFRLLVILTEIKNIKKKVVKRSHVFPITVSFTWNCQKYLTAFYCLHFPPQEFGIQYKRGRHTNTHTHRHTRS